VKDNEDLKHDNTILYQKNVHNKERLDKVQQEVEELRRFIEAEKTLKAQFEGDNQRL
jgi:hypothetical protein